MSNDASINSELIFFYEKNLNLSPDALQHLKNRSSKTIYYFAYLLILNGEDVYNTHVSFFDKNSNQYSEELLVDDNVFKMLINIVNSSPYKDEFLKVTPVAKKTPKTLQTYGKEAIVTSANIKNMENGPIGKYTTSHIPKNILDKIHPNFTQTVENYCNLIRSRAYLSLPLNSFKSLGDSISKINGVLVDFQKIVLSVYKGVIGLIQQIYAYINALMVKVQKMMISVIEQIVPLDLICLILDTLQTVLDDINFFSSLFGGNGNFSKYFNNFQNYLNQASTLVSNPFSTISAYIPSDVKNIIDLVNQVGSDPNGFLADQLSNYGYSWALNAIQGDIVGALINKYGPQYAAINQISQLLNSTENFSKSMGYIAPTPAVVGPNVYTTNGRTLDSNLTPIDFYQIQIDDFFSKSNQTIVKSLNKLIE